MSLNFARMRLAAVILTLGAAAPAMAQQSVSSTARVSPPAGVVDPNPSNNTATLRQPVVPRGSADAVTSEVVSTARVTPPAGTVDPDLSNNSATVRQPVVAPPAKPAAGVPGKRP